MTDNAEALSLSLQRLVGWKVRSGTYLAQEARLRREFRRLRADLRFRDRGLRCVGEGRVGSEGARKRTADVGAGRSPAGPDHGSKHPWGGRGGGPQGTGPSAAARRLAPKERDLLTNTIS